MSTRFYIYAKDGTPVRAKYLEINGKLIHDATGNPYIVPADFDWNTYIGKFERFRDAMAASETKWGLPNEGASITLDLGKVDRFLYDQFHAGWPASPSDIQRTYNGHAGTTGGDFVPGFTPAASFLFGAACAATGLAERGALAGGGRGASRRRRKTRS